MANQKFSDKFRECLWKVHKEKCLYCENPIRFFDLEIDHLIPEYLIDNPEEFELKKTEYGLEKTFDIQGVENLAPSCSKCNNSKSSNFFTIGQTAIFLAKIKARKNAFDECLNSKDKFRKLDNILLSIDRAIKNEVFSKSELSEALTNKGYISATNFNISSKQIITASENQKVIQDDTEIVISQHAMYQMMQRQISIDDVIYALQGGVQVENISSIQDKLINKIRTHDGLVVIFESKNEILWVVTAYWE